MRIVSWNINSVRLRAPLVEKLIQHWKPDIICLQEIKCPNDSFPEKVFRKAGYEHLAVNGIKGYHGVATLSRHPLSKIEAIDYCGQRDGRHIAVTLSHRAKPLTIHNFYVPAGGDEPDPEINDKFAHKLSFLSEMQSRFKKMKKPGRQILVGDLNIAPLEHDVWSSKQLTKVVSHTPLERAEMDKLQKTLQWHDVARQFIPPEDKLYSWWSYRAKDWEASDRGRRLDHIWTTPELKDEIAGFDVLRAARGWERPSDHVPICVDLVAT